MWRFCVLLLSLPPSARRALARPGPVDPTHACQRPSSAHAHMYWGWSPSLTELLPYFILFARKPSRASNVRSVTLSNVDLIEWLGIALCMLVEYSVSSFPSSTCDLSARILNSFPIWYDGFTSVGGKIIAGWWPRLSGDRSGCALDARRLFQNSFSGSLPICQCAPANFSRLSAAVARCDCMGKAANLLTTPSRIAVLADVS
mmetsp:Transcript_24097/g.55444  ORF Transcript_24097/g.55444 Transcript_24097/m.55444 type:complete len:202 (+) Transcript_24097:248-853(+)